MQNWIKCSERMPINPTSEEVYGQVQCLVTDGSIVGVCDYQSGNRPEAWAYWSEYGDISPDEITHWQPLPEPPQE